MRHIVLVSHEPFSGNDMFLVAIDAENLFAV
jgi:hypothetical protein